MLCESASFSILSKLRAAGHVPAFALGLLALFVVAFLAYWAFLTDFFALDDFIWLQAASNGDAADFFRRAFSWPDATPFDRQTPFWRPLVDLYFFAAWRVFGLDPLPYHVTNVLLHGAIASLVAVLVWQLTYSRLTGLLAGLLFVVLPTYDFAVIWISQVTELMAVFFSMLTLVLYTAYLRRSGPARLLYWGAFLALLFALLSKESTVTLPIVLVGLVLVIGMPKNAQMAIHRARELAPFAALTLACFLLFFFQEYWSTSRSASYQIGGHALANLWDHLRWMTLPLPNNEGPLIEDARLFAAVTFILVGCLSVALRIPLLGFTFLWTLLALLPYSFFLAGIEFRYTYLASVPFVTFLAALARAGYFRMTPGLGAYPALALAVVWVLSAAAFLGRETHERQWWISEQAELYSELYHQAPALCGSLPAESHIILLDSPIWDVYGASSAMALNLVYDDVFVHRVERSRYPGLAAFVSNKCVLQYSNGRYSIVAKD